MMRLILSLLLAPCLILQAEEFDTRNWFKGNTHTHSLWSDGNDFPEMIFDWYGSRGYDFIAISDHNVLQNGDMWMDIESIKKRQRAIGRDAISKCEARFGSDWIQWETRDGIKGIRLKTLEQCRDALEKPGQFYLLPAEEISNTSLGNLPVHINVLNISEPIAAIKDPNLSASEVMRSSLQKVKAYAESSNSPILAHLNHPNFRWSLTADDLATVAEGAFFEIYNGHPGINHLGDEKRPGDESIWDIANTIRLAELDYPPLLGVATDDSHTYHGGDVSPGRGWVVVGATSLDGDSIVTAMKDGRFYASSGVELDSIHFDESKQTLSLQIKPIEGVEFTTEFIGTRTDYDASKEVTGIGEIFESVVGSNPSFKLPDDALYLRATVTSTRKHPNASFPEQKEQAWIQPVGWQN